MKNRKNICDALTFKNLLITGTVGSVALVVVAAVSLPHVSASAPVYREELSCIQGLREISLGARMVGNVNRNNRMMSKYRENLLNQGVLAIQTRDFLLRRQAVFLTDKGGFSISLSELRAGEPNEIRLPGKSRIDLSLTDAGEVQLRLVLPGRGELPAPLRTLDQSRTSRLMKEVIRDYLSWVGPSYKALMSGEAPVTRLIPDKFVTPSNRDQIEEAMLRILQQCRGVKSVQRDVEIEIARIAGSLRFKSERLNRGLTY